MTDESAAPQVPRPAGITEYSGGIIIPAECVPFIRYQRSRYSESKVPDVEEVKRRYSAHVLEDFENMKPHLPANVTSILEVGCGVGTLQVFLQRHFPNATVQLLDGDTISREGGAGYAPKSDVYNSRKITEAMLAANGAKVDRWHDIGTKELLEADLIVSLASWGYHYPLTTYRARGFAIVDLRRGPEPSRGKKIFNGPKYDRCAFAMG